MIANTFPDRIFFTLAVTRPTMIRVDEPMSDWRLGDYTSGWSAESPITPSFDRKQRQRLRYVSD